MCMRSDNKYFTMKIDPRFSYILEILTRVNNTDKTKIVKLAISQLLEKDQEAKSVFEKTWDEDKKTRMRKLAKHNRDFLTYGEYAEFVGK